MKTRELLGEGGKEETVYTRDGTGIIGMKGERERSIENI